MNKPIATFSERLNLAMEYRGIKQIELCEKTGMSRALISQYASGKIKKIHSDRLLILSRALCVSEEWLLGMDVAMLGEKVSVYGEKIEVEFASTYTHLTEDQKEKVLSYMRFLISEGEKEKKKKTK